MSPYKLELEVEMLKPYDALKKIEKGGVILTGPRWIGKTEMLKKAAEEVKGIYCRDFEGIVKALNCESCDKVIFIDDFYSLIWQILTEKREEGKGGKAEILLKALDERPVIAMSLYELEWVLKNLANLEVPNLEGWGSKVVEKLKGMKAVLPFYSEREIEGMHRVLKFRVMGLRIVEEVTVKGVRGIHRFRARVNGERYETVVPKSVLAEQALGIEMRDPDPLLRNLLSRLAEVPINIDDILEALRNVGKVGPILLVNPLPGLIAFLASAFLGRKERKLSVLSFGGIPAHLLEEMEKENSVIPGSYVEQVRMLKEMDRVWEWMGKLKEELELMSDGFSEGLRKVERELREVLREISRVAAEQVSFYWRPGYGRYATIEDVGRYLYGSELFEGFVDMLECPEYLELVREVVEMAREDLVIVTGPSGSGKTSLLLFTARLLDRAGIPFSYLLGEELRRRGLDRYHADRGVYLFLNDPGYEEFRAVWGSPYRKYVIMAIRDQILEEFLKRYAMEERKNIERLLNGAYKNAVTIEYEEAKKYLEHMISKMAKVDGETVKAILEGAKSRWHVRGRGDVVSPSFYYAYLVVKGLKEGKISANDVREGKLPKGLLELEASFILNDVWPLGDLEAGRPLDVDAFITLLKAASVLVPLAALGINSRLSVRIFSPFLDHIIRYFRSVGEEKGVTYDRWDEFRKEVRELVIKYTSRKGANFVGFPHDSWEILLDVTPLNREYGDGKEGRKLELLMELIMNHLADEAPHHNGIRARFAAFVNNLTYEALRGYEREFFEGLTGKWYSKLFWENPLEASRKWRFRVSVKHLCRLIKDEIDLRYLKEDMLLCQEFWEWVFEDLGDRLPRRVDRLIEAVANGIEADAWALVGMADTGAKGSGARGPQAKALVGMAESLVPRRVDKLIEAFLKLIRATAGALYSIALANEAAFSQVRAERVDKLIEAAVNGVEAAARALRWIAWANERLAPRVVDGLIEAAVNGVEAAAEALYWVARVNKAVFSQVSSHQIESLIDSILSGNFYAAVALRQILEANRKVLSFITEEQLQELTESAIRGSRAAIRGLQGIASLNDLHAKEAMDGLVRAAIRGYAEAAVVIEHQAEWYRDSLSNVTPEQIAELRKAAEKGVKAASRALKAILSARPDLKK